MHSSTEETLGLHGTQLAMDAYSGGFELRPDEALTIARWFPKPPARILDLGVGNGRTTVPLAVMGYDVVGIEYCSELVAVGKKMHPTVDLRWGDARKLEFPDQSFDVAWFSWNGIDYMQPLSERIQVLAEMHRCVKPGGIIFVSSHNALGVLYRLFRPLGLTLRGLRFVFDQIRFYRRRKGWYCVWRDDALASPVFYSAPPSINERMLRDAGLEPLAVLSVQWPDQPARWWRDVHVNYVCRRP